MIKPKIFIHCGNQDEKYIPIMKEFFDAIEKSKQKNNVDVVVSCVGIKRDTEFWFDENYFYPDFTYGEFFTLTKLKDFCDTIDLNIPICYLNTKGTFSGFDNPCVSDWRHYMTYFILEKMIDCIGYIHDLYDAVGVDWKTIPNKHFSGNFWWASSKYIKSLPKIDPDNVIIENLPTKRHFSEFWIGYNNPNVKCLHNSNIDVYSRHLHRYLPENYKL